MRRRVSRPARSTKRSPGGIYWFHLPNRTTGTWAYRISSNTVEDEHLRELLDVAIQGRGAFRRFKDVLARHPAEQQRCYEFQAARLDARVREWLAEKGCEPA
jgi:hypothetical protein